MASRQNKIKPRHPLLPPAQQVLKKSPAKYLTPKLFLSLQQKSLEIYFQPFEKEFQPKSYCNKYFGKRALYVTNLHDLNRAMNSCKLIQRVKFNKNMCSKEGFKATGDLILIGQEIPIKMNQITKITRECKGRISFVLNKNKYRYTEEEMLRRRNQKNPIKFNFNVWIKKWIKNFHVNLQNFSLTFQSVDQFPVFKGHLRNLRHLSLKFDKEFARKCGWKIDPPLEYTFKNLKDKYFKFILQLVQGARQLQTLRLDLAPYSITSTPLAYLLLIVNYHQIPDWYVRIGALSEDFMKILNGTNIKEIDKMAPVGLKSTSEVLKTVDFLGLYVVNYLEEIDDEFAFDKYEDYGAFRTSVARLGELPEVTCKYKRILDVTLTDFSLETKSFHPLDSPWTVNLKAILSHFPELQGIYIKAIENVIIYEDNESDLQKKGKKKSRGSKKIKDVLPWTRNLREVFLSFLSLSGENRLNFKYQTESFSKFMGTLKTQCPQLTSLNVFKGYPNFDWDGQVTICTENHLTGPCEEITGMSSLRELEIYSDNKGLKSVGKTLETLKSLEKLRINIDNNDQHRTFFDFLAERNWERRFYDFGEKEKILCFISGIKELELVINKSGYSIKWADHFAKYIGGLKSLEVLRVFDGNKDEIQLEVLMKIVDGLSRKKTLRRVEIDSAILKNDSTLEFAAGLWDGLSKGDIEELGVKNFRGLIEKMVELNLGLELVDIKDFKGMKFERILYDIRTKV